VSATGDLVFRKGSNGHYVKDPGEHHAIVPLRKVPQLGSISGDHLRLWELVAKSFLAYRIHRSRLGWFDLQLGRADPLRLFHRGEV
jgi:DNA topoisomerase IA